MNIFLNEKILISGQEWISDDSSEISNNLDTLLECLNCFNYYTEPTVYYTATGLVSFFANINILDSITDYSLSNPVDRLRTILSGIAAIDWDTCKQQRTDKIYYYIEHLGATTHNVNGTSIAEAAEYEANGSKAVLLNLTACDHNTSPINITRANIPPPNDMKMFPLPVIHTKEQTIAYITTGMTVRTFNWNPKHGENGTGVISNKGEIVSPLECSREKAAAMLPHAVNSRTTNHELYAYHESIGKFIVFKYENTPENSYHAYHPINQTEVPQDVKNFLRGL